MAKKRNNQKKSWKKLAKGIEQGLPEYHAAKALRELPDTALFEVDDTPDVTLTTKQKRLAAHKARLAQVAEDQKNDVKDVKPVLKTIAKNKRVVLPKKADRNKVERKPLEPLKGKPVVEKDPWGEDNTTSGNDFLAPVKTHDLKTRKKALPKVPRNTKSYIPSAVPKVKLPESGASYNPGDTEYFNYAHKIADEEVAREKNISKVHKSTKLNDGQSYITHDEKQAEIEQGFFDSESSDDSEEEQEPGPAPAKRTQPKPKTDKQRKRQLRHKIMEMTRKAQKELTKKERVEIANLKKTYKELVQKQAEIKAKAAERRLNKVYDTLTSRKKLGRGEFQEYEEPVLLPDEITASVRLTKTEGNIISERFKSLQERNIIPVAGDKESRKLPKRLKRKWVERRDTKDVSAAT
uniref:Ribosome biogenesis protein NOP53 n=1 Tax=Panagrellus redivivus TaxID=6233 RepID=A0A7E4VER6_PANRE